MAQSYEAPSPHFTSVLFRVAYLPLPFLSVLNQTINGYKLSACVAMDRNAVNGIYVAIRVSAIVSAQEQ
jgi:hypothetical protein